MSDESDRSGGAIYKSFSRFDWVKVSILLASIGAFLFAHFVLVQKFTKLFEDQQIDPPLISKCVVDGRLYLIAAYVLIAYLVLVFLPTNRLGLIARRRLMNGGVILSFAMVLIWPYALVLPTQSLTQKMAEREEAANKLTKEAMSDAQLDPIPEGAVKGFRIKAIRKGGRFDQMGAQVGDVVRAINFVEVSATEAGAEYVFKLATIPGSKFDVYRPKIGTAILMIAR